MVMLHKEKMDNLRVKISTYIGLPHMPSRWFTFLLRRPCPSNYPAPLSVIHDSAVCLIRWHHFTLIGFIPVGQNSSS